MSKTLLCFLGLWVLLSLNCSSSKGTTQPTKEDLQKIKFNLNQLDEEGLQGPEGGKVALNYEFCIPNAPTFIKEAQRIDPGLQMHVGSRGRIGCLRGKEILCIGSTHQKGYRDILYQLAALPYIKSIEQTFFE
jgi:hypothetical protein